MLLWVTSATAAWSPSAEAWATSGMCRSSTAARTLRGSRSAGLTELRAVAHAVCLGCCSRVRACDAFGALL